MRNSRLKFYPAKTGFIVRTLLKAFGLLLLPCLCAITANAQKSIEKVETKAGVISVQALIGSACDPLVQCNAVLLGDKILAKDYHASIQFAYPTQANPKLIGIYTGTGGNACCWQTDLVDLTTTPPLIVGEIGDGRITDAPDGVQIARTSGLNALGDNVVTTYRYAWGSGRLETLKQTVATSTGPIDQRQYSNEALSNTNLREPLLQLFGQSYFAEFRKTILVGNPVKVIDNRYVIGSGCTPHACCASASVFVIDQVANKAWALQLRNDSCREGANKAVMWGTLAPADAIPRRELEQWLTRNKMNWYNVSIAKN